MNSRHRKTRDAIFKDPVSKTLVWADVENMLVGIGCSMTEGAGSRVRFVYGTHVYAAHRPHPEKEAKPYVIRAVRDYLTLIGHAPPAPPKTPKKAKKR